MVQWLESAKKHPFIALPAAIFAVVTFVVAVVELTQRAVDSVSGIVDPHQAQYAALAGLELDSTPEYVESRIGRPQSVSDLCDEVLCPEQRPAGALKLHVYRAEHFVVRAVFEESNLEMFTVTLTTGEMHPPMSWLDYELGELGTVTFVEALAPVTTVEGPTSMVIHSGPSSAAYAEVFAFGAPARYEAFMLGWAPDGFAAGDMQWDARSAGELAALASDLGDPGNAETVAAFRSRSTPNTYGHFRDDSGYVGELFQDARECIVLMHSNSF